MEEESDMNQVASEDEAVAVAAVIMDETLASTEEEMDQQLPREENERSRIDLTTDLDSEKKPESADSSEIQAESKSSEYENHHLEEDYDESQTEGTILNESHENRNQNENENDTDANSSTLAAEDEQYKGDENLSVSIPNTTNEEDEEDMFFSPLKNGGPGSLMSPPKQSFTLNRLAEVVNQDTPTSKMDPEEEEQEVEEDEELQPLQIIEGWAQYISPEGSTYWFHSETNISQWTVPSAVLAAQQVALKDGDNILHAACSYQYEDDETFFETLSENKHLIDQGNENGDTPLHIAIQNVYYYGIDLLLQNGANLNALNNKYQSPVFSCFAKKEYSKDLLSYLINLSANIDIDIKDKDGNTLLHTACYSNDSECLKILMECIRSSNVPYTEKLLLNYEENTPLHIAASYGNLEVVEVLLHYASQISMNDSKDQMFAVLLGHRNSNGELADDICFQPEVKNLIAWYQSSLRNGRQEEMQKKLVQINEKISAYEKQMQTLTNQISQYKQNESKTNNDVINYLNEIEELKGSLNQRDEYINQLQGELNDNQSAIASVQAMYDGAVNVRKRLEQRVNTLEEQNQTLQKQLSAAEIKTYNAEQRSQKISNDLATQYDDMQAEYNKLQNELNHYKSKSPLTVTSSSRSLLSSFESAHLQQPASVYDNQQVDLNYNATAYDAFGYAQPSEQTVDDFNYSSGIISEEQPVAAFSYTNGIVSEEQPVADFSYTNGVVSEEQLVTDFSRANGTSEVYEWQKHTAEDGSTYFYNPSTNESSWSDPTAVSTAPPLPPAEDQEGSVSTKPERLNAVWTKFFENALKANLSGQANDQLNRTERLQMQLYEAVEDVDIERVNDLLLNQGALAHLADVNGCTPLHRCCSVPPKRGRKHHDLSIDESSSSHTAMVVRIAALLVEQGADIDIADNSGITPLHIACAVGNACVTEFLLQSACVVDVADVNGDTALHIAATGDTKGNLKCVQLLTQYGASLRWRNNDDSTAEECCYQAMILTDRPSKALCRTFDLLKKLGNALLENDGDSSTGDNPMMVGEVRTFQGAVGSGRTAPSRASGSEPNPFRRKDRQRYYTNDDAFEYRSQSESDAVEGDDKKWWNKISDTANRMLRRTTSQEYDNQSQFPVSTSTPAAVAAPPTDSELALVPPADVQNAINLLKSRQNEEDDDDDAASISSAASSIKPPATIAQDLNMAAKQMNFVV